MPANRRRTISLTEQHDDLIEYVMKSLGVDVSKACRTMFDMIIDTEPNVTIQMLEKDRRMKKLELASLDQRIALAKNSAKDSTFRKLSVQKGKDTSSDARTLEEMTPKEVISNYVDDVQKDTPTGALARQRIKAVLEEHPELLTVLPRDVRRMFKHGGEH